MVKENSINPEACGAGEKHGKGKKKNPRRRQWK